MRFRDLTKLHLENYGNNIQAFHSIDEIYYFMDTLFTEGFTEHHINLALDIFLRDAHLVEDKDLEKDTF